MAESRVDRRLRFLRSGINANFSVICKDREWRVDRGVLAAESDYFQKLCIGDFSEASSGKVTFPEEDPEVIDQVLVYLYTGAYDDMAVVASLEERTTASQTSSQCDNASEYGASQEGSVEPPDAAIARSLKELTVAASAWTVANDCPVVAARLLDSVSAETITSVLKTGIKVYRCAKMMNLAELEAFAFWRFMEKEEYLPKSDLAEVLTTLYKNAESNDKVLRLKVTGRCVENHLVLKEKNGEAVRVLEEYEACGWEIGVELLIARKQELAKYEEESYQHRLTRIALLEKTNELTQNNETLMETLADISSIKHDWDRLPWDCTSCGRDMGTSRFIRARGPSGRLQIMCRCNRKYECGQQGLY